MIMEKIGIVIGAWEQFDVYKFFLKQNGSRVYQMLGEHSEDVHFCSVRRSRGQRALQSFQRFFVGQGLRVFLAWT